MVFHSANQPCCRLRAALSLIAILAACICLSGCATMEDESDLPWATPESWEGSPSIPGFNQY